MSETKFKYIANQITSRIEQGIYAARARLPPHRELAKELGTTPATVSKAYKLLSELGRVKSFVGRGTFVRDKSALSQVIQPQHQELDFNFSILQPCLGLNLNALTEAYSQTAETLTKPGDTIAVEALTYPGILAIANLAGRDIAKQWQQISSKTSTKQRQVFISG